MVQADSGVGCVCGNGNEKVRSGTAGIEQLQCDSKALGLNNAAVSIFWGGLCWEKKSVVERDLCVWTLRCPFNNQVEMP